MRPANAIDFWRGVALLMIFINHIPGNVLGQLTLRNYAISDAAELFVFLAGWSVSYATGGPHQPERAKRTVFRMLSRAVEIYRAQLVITMLALAFLASVALLRDNPLFLEWHNAGSVFYDPIRAIVGIVLLTHQLGYFNILPLYVVLLLFAPIMVLLGRWRRWAILSFSIGIYLFALITWATLPNWPAEERWYFNPMSWQVLFVLGFLSSELSQSSEALKRILPRMMPFAWVLVAGGAYIMLNELWPDPMQVPEPKLFFLFDKTYLSPIRIVSLMALVIAFSTAFKYLERPLGPVTSLMCAYGRNSLAVFCIGSLLSLIGQVVRAINEESIVLDFVLVLVGIVLMGLTAWFVEWRSRVPGLALSRAS